MFSWHSAPFDVIDLFHHASRGEEKDRKCFRGTAERETLGVFFPGMKSCCVFPAILVLGVFFGGVLFFSRDAGVKRSVPARLALSCRVQIPCLSHAALSATLIQQTSSFCP